MMLLFKIVIPYAKLSFNHLKNFVDYSEYLNFTKVGNLKSSKLPNSYCRKLSK